MTVVSILIVLNFRIKTSLKLTSNIVYEIFFEYFTPSI